MMLRVLYTAPAAMSVSWIRERFRSPVAVLAASCSTKSWSIRRSEVFVVSTPSTSDFAVPTAALNRSSVVSEIPSTKSQTPRILSTPPVRPGLVMLTEVELSRFVYTFKI